MTRLPWGHKSRNCVRCRGVGPRIVTLGGYVHYYCLTDEEKAERRREARALKNKPLKRR